MSAATEPVSASCPGSAPAGNGSRRPDGTFAPGWRGGGRPRGSLDLRVLAEQRLQEQGKTLADAVWEVFETMLDLATKGDIHAAKLVLERLLGKETERFEFSEELTPSQRVERIKALLAAAALRRQGEDQ